MAHWTTKTNHLPTPCYLIDEKKLTQNLDKIKALKNATDCHVILALKGFATTKTFPQLNTVLNGVTASSIYEARLGLEEFHGSLHVHSIAIDEEEYHQYNAMASHISFNSIKQAQRFKEKNTEINASLGLRINPKISQAPTEKYDPCSKFSRLGIPIEQITKKDLDGIDGLHFHALCEQNVGPLLTILNKIEQTLGDQLATLKWMNWGGGHLLTDDNYERDILIKEINRWKSTYNLQVILEPGEAIGRHCGYYVTRILDIVENHKKIAICDISATAHMPDVLEYPYRPEILNGGEENEKKENYIIAGNTCLAGDMVGTYSFDDELNINDTLIFDDMGHYTIVKTSNFNGVKQPAIGMIDTLGNIKIHKVSSYFNFKERLS
jgi:carboxynorspermidine decarboxylase